MESEVIELTIQNNTKPNSDISMISQKKSNSSDSSNSFPSYCTNLQLKVPNSNCNQNQDKSASNDSIIENNLKVRIRLQLMNSSYVEKLENFLYTHFLPDQCLNIALGHFAEVSEDSPGRIQCKRSASYFAKAAIQCNPIASVIAINEENDEIIGMRLNDISWINENGVVEDQFDHKYDKFIVILYKFLIKF